MVAESDLEHVFLKLYHAGNESEVEEVIKSNPNFFRDENWKAYGEDKNYFAVVENQQASPIPALIEKITNSIDAILTKKCLESGIDPGGIDAPKSMDEAIERFFPDFRNWDIRQSRRKQAEEIQVIADGPKGDTSLIIFDNGEGQHPNDFPRTFLSLLKGNKTNIQFVQGKFNMGGSGALIFCGNKRYQLIASRKFDKSGKFGFTLVRRHQLSQSEEETARFLWYEYWVIDGNIPCFNISTLDLGLFNRLFETGTIIKLYSYKIHGISDISRDLNLAINEFLFQPALPIFTIEKPERYPDTPQPQRELFGLKRRIERSKDDYLEWESCFSENYTDNYFGKIHVNVYVFKTRIKGKSIKDSRKAIWQEFYKNKMSVLFGLNGQVHGSYTTEFISKTLKFSLLKDHILIFVDCSKIKTQIRNELFMGSRDRLKEGEVTKRLRDFLGNKLRNSKLKEVNRRRKDTISVEEGETNEVIKSIAKNMALNSDMLAMLRQVFSLDLKGETGSEKKSSHPAKPKREPKEQKAFFPNRYPTFFRLIGEKDGKRSIVKIPSGSEKTIRFESDIDNDYFDRSEDPGGLVISVQAHNSNQKTNAGTGSINPIPSKSNKINFTTASPDKGIIRIVLSAESDLEVGEQFEVQVTLQNPAGDSFHKHFVAIISEPEVKKNNQDPVLHERPPQGLPQLLLVYEKRSENVEENTFKGWEDVDVEIDWNTIMHPVIDEDLLESIIINMDSRELKNYKANLTSASKIEFADKRYITTIYFHTIVLYATLSKGGYQSAQFGAANEDRDELTLSELLKKIFSTYYGGFLLRFGMEELLNSID